MEMMNFYELLGVSYYATADEIKVAYRKKVKEKHPDKAEGNVEQFKLVLEAYDVLSNEEKRKRYDDFLFKTIKFNIQVAVPKEKEKVTQKYEKINKKEGQWKFSFLLFLTTTLILIGLSIYLLNEYQQANRNNILLDNRLSSMSNEVKDLTNDNNQLDSGLTTKIEENQVLTGEIRSLKEENLQLNSNLITLQSSLEQSNSEPKEENGLDYVTLGSTEEEVLQILGTPERIDFLTWSYGYNSSVSFDYFTKTVDGWNNGSGKLNIK